MPEYDTSHGLNPDEERKLGRRIRVGKWVALGALGLLTIPIGGVIYMLNRSTGQALLPPEERNPSFVSEYNDVGGRVVEKRVVYPDGKTANQTTLYVMDIDTLYRKSSDGDKENWDGRELNGFDSTKHSGLVSITLQMHEEDKEGIRFWQSCEEGEEVSWKSRQFFVKPYFKEKENKKD